MLIFKNKKIRMKKILFAISISFITLISFAEEGMLIPSLIQAFQSDMKAKGMKLSAEQIYSINNSSLKDAVISFNGGCTAEIISDQGLILTNHHCGFYNIQSHSSLENDYLKNGFWAKTKAEELANPGLTATRIVRIDDVTASVLFGVTDETPLNERNQKIKENIQQIITDKSLNTHYKIDIKEFDYGNSFYAMTTEVFTDVRLVGAPPSSIGKFGGDTDNWVWPRHTGDFALFRIYAGPDNKPAVYNQTNVPYVPEYSLTIDAGHRKSGEFTMVYGFPGVTEQHTVSGQLAYLINRERPARIGMREKSLSIINTRMRASDDIRIKYAAKQATIANSYKKWIGQVQGLVELNAIEIKKQYEAKYTKTAQKTEQWRNRYGDIVQKMNNLFEENKEYDFTNTMIMEYIYIGGGPEFFKQVRVVDELVKNYDKYKSAGEIPTKIEKIKTSYEKFFKNYNKEIDQTIFNLLHAEFIHLMNPNYLPTTVLSKKTEEWSNEIYTKSIFTDKEKLAYFYANLNDESILKIKQDPAYILYTDIINKFSTEIVPRLDDFNAKMDDLLKIYIEGKHVMFPKDKHWPDANGTLRIAYGKLEGSSPKDGLEYKNHSTVEGILEKNRTNNPDFELLPRIKELYEKKEYGGYDQDGELWVCYTASNHTTGGNSGSPVLNKDGYFIGINFDRTWESTMSDYMFDPSRCRNIVCDSRYILWVIDVYAEADNLIEEMHIITEKDKRRKM